MPQMIKIRHLIVLIVLLISVTASAQNRPLDAQLPVWQHRPMLSGIQKQFSITHAASSPDHVKKAISCQYQHLG
jgi:hypothetical protein